MTGLLDPFEFALAETLHMTVGELRTRISNEEFMQWAAFWKYRNEMRELALKEAKNG